MQTDSPQALGKLMTSFCGKRIGSLISDRVQSDLSGAMLMDATHDNPSMFEKRNIHEILPTAAMGMKNFKNKFVLSKLWFYPKS